MIHILPSARADELRQYTDEYLIRRLDESRNIFLALGEKRYFLTFHWLDGKKVTIYADSKDFVIVTDSEGAAESAGNIDVPEDGILQLHEFLLELTANDVYKLESLENMIISLEDNLLMDKTPSKDGIRDIIKVRKDLLKVKRYYEQMEFLTDEIAAMPNLKLILTLGGIAHNAVLSVLGYKKSNFKFKHGAVHFLDKHNLLMLNSYHTSRYNINTGVLTFEMFEQIVAQFASLLVQK